MDHVELLKAVSRPLGDAVVVASGPKVSVRNRAAVQQRIEPVVRTAALAKEPERSLARWLIREVALAVGVVPASIHELYMARGRDETRQDFTVPAMNLRALPFHAARAVFRAARRGDTLAMIFELARSEMGYSDQRPAEYSACILGAAIAEGYQGPVFIQGDHFQAGAKKYEQKPEEELQALRGLIDEAIDAGFFNIDIDTSTLVDLSKPTIPEQQHVNYTLCAELTAHLRRRQPKGVTISIGGEIGEVGGHNSTEPELRAFMDGYKQSLGRLLPGQPGLSKISIQTGTSHGGVVLPDGSIAQVKVDFDTLAALSRLARQAYGLGGAVQHGASTLPEDAFTRFAEAGTLEVHLATNFQNMLYDRLPEDVLGKMYAYLHEKHSDERKAGQTDEQFYYSARKRALGPFKQTLWDLPAVSLETIQTAWERQFGLLFDRLNVGGTRAEVTQHIHAEVVHAPLGAYLKAAGIAEDVKELAD